MTNLRYTEFSKLNLADPFFDSLKSDYPQFTTWFSAKAEAGERAYAFTKSNGLLDGLLYVKLEIGVVSDTKPPLRDGRHLKIGTLKINAHNTKLGQRFLKKVFDHAIKEKVDDVYVTVFSKHEPLIGLLKKYGFKDHAKKIGAHGEELVLVKDLLVIENDVLLDYPRVRLDEKRPPHLLAIYPKYHTQFLPDSKLNNEDIDIVQDISHTNSIHKVYISGCAGTGKLVPGDVLLMYRTTDIQGKAYFRSVATSIVVVEEVRKIKSFASKFGFMKYVAPYSVFNQLELDDYYNNKKHHIVIKFTYNVALTKRLNRKNLLEVIGISTSPRWDFRKITSNQLNDIIQLSQVNENYFIN